MDEKIEHLILLLRSHLLGFDAKTAFPGLSEQEWAELYDLSVSHGVQGFAYEGAYRSGIVIPEELKQRWRDRMVEDVLRYYSMQRELMRVIEALKQNGAKPVVLKGISVSRLYPIPELRLMGDIDILVSDRYYEAALCLEEMGYKAQKEVAIHHIEFLHSKYLIELHRLPFTPIGIKHYDKLVKAVDFTGAEFQIININGFDIPVLNGRNYIDESFEHILKHLIHDRITLRNLCDMAMLFKGVQDEDWKVDYDLISACGLGDLLSGIASLLVVEFGLPAELVKGIPIMEADREKEFARGVFSVSDAKTGTNRYYTSLPATGAVRMLLRYLRAVSRDLLIKYPYCRKNVLLRPAAFIHAYSDYLFALIHKAFGRGGQT
ncbi:MAG: nucleotidyltransferase family protein [Oscillospiraceae bacterium]|nr:nucleotidyltransferase family protein [Oscillospiraceae bacterium]